MSLLTATVDILKLLFAYPFTFMAREAVLPQTDLTDSEPKTISRQPPSLLVCIYNLISLIVRFCHKIAACLQEIIFKYCSSKFFYFNYTLLQENKLILHKKRFYFKHNCVNKNDQNKNFLCISLYSS